MPLDIPSSIGQFFTLYPNAQPAFVFQDGTAYRADYTQSKAVLRAKQQNQKLYLFSDESTFEQIHPAYPDDTNGIAHVGNNIVSDITDVEVAGESEPLADNTISALRDAAKKAANAAGLCVFAVSGEITTEWDVTIRINEPDVTIRVKDGNGDWQTLLTA